MSFAGTAWAAPFVWTPSAASPALTGAPIDASNILITDFDSINTATGAFNGVLGLTGFQTPAGQTFLPSGYGTTYSLYLTFSGTSNPLAIPTTPTSATSSAFTSLSYTLWANQGPLPNFAITTAGPTITGTSSPFALATGSLISGTGTLTNTGVGPQPISPGANVLVTLNPAAGEAGFFTSPPPSAFNLDLFGNFSSTVTNVGISGGFVLIGGGANAGVGGGGNLTLQSTPIPTPEPFSLTLLGSGLAGLGLVRWGRKKS